MARYMGIVNGIKTLIAAVASSTGASDAGKIPELDGTGRLDVTLMPSGVGPSTKVATANEGLAASDLVNLYNNGGSLGVRKADASVAGGARRANGFVLANVTNGSPATVYLSGVITGLSGLTIGAKQFLSATAAGTRTETAPTTIGHYLQPLGDAISATELAFEPDEGTIL